MNEEVAVVITGIIVIIIGVVFCINETICPFGMLVMLAGGIVIGVGFILDSGGW